MALPEIHETEATGETAAIYDALRKATGVPLVNLIWRHFATLPGVLPWAWTTTGPVIGSRTVRDGLGRIERRVHALAGAQRPALPELSADQLAVVEIYNRGNLTNLQVLTALRRAVAGEACGDGAPLEQANAPLPPLAPVAPIPRLETLEPASLHQVQDLAALHGETAASAIPSLYRHLALWPEILPPLHAALADVVQTGLIERGRDAVKAEAEATASRLLPAMRPPGPFPEDGRVATLKALEAFTGRLIAEMSVVGLMLKQGTAPAQAG